MLSVIGYLLKRPNYQTSVVLSERLTCVFHVITVCMVWVGGNLCPYNTGI